MADTNKPKFESGQFGRPCLGLSFGYEKICGENFFMKERIRT